jgi:hypothetical protein
MRSPRTLAKNKSQSPNRVAMRSTATRKNRDRLATGRTSRVAVATPAAKATATTAQA